MRQEIDGQTSQHDTAPCPSRDAGEEQQRVTRERLREKTLEEADATDTSLGAVLSPLWSLALASSRHRVLSVPLASC